MGGVCVGPRGGGAIRSVVLQADSEQRDLERSAEAELLRTDASQRMAGALPHALLLNPAQAGSCTAALVSGANANQPLRQSGTPSECPSENLLYFFGSSL